MTDVYFYHLERSSPEEVLPSLLEKTLAKGWRAMVRTSGREEQERLDEALWTYRDESFLPHGTSGADQPVLVTQTDEAENEAKAAFLMPGADMADEAMKRFERCVLFFTGAERDAARAAWTRFKEAGFAVTYWKQTQAGGWQRQG
jgi:DNA polymerase-3 subunit chi